MALDKPTVTIIYMCNLIRKLYNGQIKSAFVFLFFGVRGCVVMLTCIGACVCAFQCVSLWICMCVYMYVYVYMYVCVP